MCVGTHPFIPVPNTARVRLVYTQFGQTLENVFNFERAGPFSSADLLALNASILTEWTVNIMPEVTVDATLVLIESTALDSAMGFQETTSVGVVGGNAGGGTPTGVTLAIKFASGLAGRSQRGRMYWIGTSVGQIVGDQYDAGQAAGILAAVTAFFGLVFATTASAHVIVSYCNAGAWRITGQTTPVTDYILTDTNIDSQRRRLAGRGI